MKTDLPTSIVCALGAVAGVITGDYPFAIMSFGASIAYLRLFCKAKNGG